MFMKKQTIQIEKLENGFYVALSQAEHGGAAPSSMLLPKVEFVAVSAADALVRVTDLIGLLQSVKDLNEPRSLPPALPKDRRSGTAVDGT